MVYCQGKKSSLITILPVKIPDVSFWADIPDPSGCPSAVPDL